MDDFKLLQTLLKANDIESVKTLLNTTSDKQVYKGKLNEQKANYYIELVLYLAKLCQQKKCSFTWDRLDTSENANHMIIIDQIDESERENVTNRAMLMGFYVKQHDKLYIYGKIVNKY